MSVKLYNTGTTKAYDQKDLNTLFNTKSGEYLESNRVPVIGRKFNWLPTAGKGDPPRSLTDPSPNKTLYANNNIGVVSDFPKSNTAHDIGRLWLDGTYSDMVNDVDDDNEAFYKMLKFAPDSDFNMRFARLEREQELPSNIANYFNEREAERERERRIYLEEFGLTTEEVERAISEKKVKDALIGLESGKRLIGTKSKQLEKAIEKATGKIRDELTPEADMSRVVVKRQEVSASMPVRPFGRHTLLSKYRTDVSPAVEGVFGGAGDAPVREPFIPTSGLPLLETRGKGRPTEQSKIELAKSRANNLIDEFVRNPDLVNRELSKESDAEKLRLMSNLFLKKSGEVEIKQKGKKIKELRSLLFEYIKKGVKV